MTLARARDLGERTEVLERVMAFDERVELYPLERSAAEYFGRWWVPVIRELSAVEGHFDSETVAATFSGNRCSP